MLHELATQEIMKYNIFFSSTHFYLMIFFSLKPVLMLLHKKAQGKKIVCIKQNKWWSLSCNWHTINAIKRSLPHINFSSICLVINLIIHLCWNLNVNFYSPRLDGCSCGSVCIWECLEIVLCNLSFIFR